MNLQPLHEKLNREHPRFSAHLTFEERDAIARTIIHSIGDVAPDMDTAPRATGSPEDRRIGQPEGMWLDEYGSLLVGVFGYCVYHVGSSMSRKRGWSDVDIRVILTDEQYAAWGLGHPRETHSSPRWLGLCRAFSEIGFRMTRLPIDFQIQQMTQANEEFGDKPRSALLKHDGSTVASDDLPASPSLVSATAGDSVAKALRLSRKLAEWEVEQGGPCDHQTGHCNCPALDALAAIDEAERELAASPPVPESSTEVSKEVMSSAVHLQQRDGMSIAPENPASTGAAHLTNAEEVLPPVPESPSMTLGATGDRISVRLTHGAVPERPSPDSVRLDWLEATHRAERLTVSITTNGLTDMIHILDDDESLLGRGSTLREAIDAARGESPSPVPEQKPE